MTAMHLYACAVRLRAPSDMFQRVYTAMIMPQKRMLTMPDSSSASEVK
jgi:hypothetical protein